MERLHRVSFGHLPRHFLFWFAVLTFMVDCTGSEPSSGREIGGDSPRAATPVRVAIYDLPGPSFLGLIYASKTGLYEKAGLPPVELMWRDDQLTVFDLLKSGKADFAVAWMAEGLCAASEGLDIVAISRITQVCTETVYVRRDVNPTFRKLDDLAGRKVGVGFRRDLSSRAFFHRLGIQPEYVVFRPESGFLFNAGVVDAVTMPQFRVDIYYHYTRVRDEIHILPLRNNGIHYPEETVFCKRDFLKKNPDLCRRFIRATWTGWREALDNRKESVSMLTSFSCRGEVPADPFYVNQLLERWAPFLQLDKKLEKNGNCDAKSFDQLRTDLISAKLLDARKAPQYSTFFYNVNDSGQMKTLPNNTTVGPKEK